MSTRTGRPPAWTTAAAVAKKVLVGTRTSLPSTPSALRMISSELVPLLTAMPWRHPQNWANFCSNSAPYLPRVNCPVDSTSWIRSAIQSRSSGRNWILAAGTVRFFSGTGAGETAPAFRSTAVFALIK